MADPLVSVLITAYNHEKYIRKAIEGCLMQETSFPFEIIIHDDASTDKTAQIIREYAEKHPEVIKTIIQTENQYSKLSRLTARLMVPIAKGKFIAFCEGDDYWTDPKKLEKQITVMENDPTISLCFTASKWVYVNAKKRDKIMSYHNGNHYFSSDEVIMRRGKFSDIVTTIVRKDIYNHANSWFYLPANGDFALYLLSVLSGQAYYLDEVTAVYHRGVENSWSTKNQKLINESREFFEKTINMRNEFNEYSNHRFQKAIRKQNFRELISLSFAYRDEDEFKHKYFAGFTTVEKIEYFFFHKLVPIEPRFLWHRYRDLLRILRLW